MMGDQISKTDKAIIDLWKQYGAVKPISIQTGCSHHKITKCLATHGYVLNAAHAKILELYSQGVGVEDISKAVKLSLSSVRAYLPRERPEYGQHYSKNAKIIYNWRQKKERN
jgi:hypothetical protein|nr:MAG TPA: Protein of unknown function (DUF2802) [Caudoviricetes sp.]